MNYRTSLSAYGAQRNALNVRTAEQLTRSKGFHSPHITNRLLPGHSRRSVTAPLASLCIMNYSAHHFPDATAAENTTVPALHFNTASEIRVTHLYQWNELKFGPYMRSSWCFSRRGGYSPKNLRIHHDVPQRSLLKASESSRHGAFHLYHDFIHSPYVSLLTIDCQVEALRRMSRLPVCIGPL